MANVTCLDLRGLPAPEPLLRALAAVDALAADATLELLTPLLPMPLLAELDERGMHYEVEPRPDGGVCVRIRHAEAP